MRVLEPIALATAMMLIMAVGAKCETASSETREVLAIVTSPTFNYDAKGRADFLRALSAYCSATTASLPTNTPQEQDWVETEQNTTDSNKIVRLISTPEWGRYRLGRTYNECVTTTAKISLAQHDSDRRLEAAFWISLSITFNDDDEVKRAAKVASVDLPRHGVYFILHMRRGIMIAAVRAIEEMR